MDPQTHPERVAHAVPNDCKTVALLHDAIEDGHLTYGAIRGSLIEVDANALAFLTRHPEQTYAEYIDEMVIGTTFYRTRLAAEIAITVKIADLNDNLYGRPEGPPNASLRRRYENALATLQAAQATT